MIKTYHELTRLGRLRRLRKLAEKALTHYGISDAILTFQHYGGNVIFRVDVLDPVAPNNNCEFFLPNRYNLRILSTNNPQFTQSELTWITALNKELGLPVPEPVSNLDGHLITTISTPGVPQGKVVSLMRWVDGRHYAETSLRPHHAKAWGQLTGRMHQFAAQWTPPDDFKRFHWDWDGQLGNGVLRTPVNEVVASMPIDIQKPFTIISKQLKDVLKSIGKGPDAFGMIHSDMYLENVLFKAGKPRLIDFEDCGFGYWMLDIGIVLAQFRWTDQWERIREAFLDGYLQMHSLPALQLEQIDLFMAMPTATNVLWASAMILEDPAMRAENEKWRDKDGKNLLRFFNKLQIT